MNAPRYRYEEANDAVDGYRHAATPWHCVDLGEGRDWSVQSVDLNGSGDYVGNIYSKPNAAHIVRRVNAHDELFAALRDLLHSIQPPALLAENMSRCPAPKYIAQARAALAKVQA